MDAGASKSGKMAEGKEKNAHVKAGLDGGASKSGTMAEGKERDEHLKDASDGKAAARMRLIPFFNQTNSREWGGALFLHARVLPRERRLEK